MLRAVVSKPETQSLSFAVVDHVVRDHNHGGFSLDIFVVDSTHPDVGALLKSNSTREKKQDTDDPSARDRSSRIIGHFGLCVKKPQQSFS